MLRRLAIVVAIAIAFAALIVLQRTGLPTPDGVPAPRPVAGLPLGQGVARQRPLPASSRRGEGPCLICGFDGVLGLSGDR